MSPDPVRVSSEVEAFLQEHRRTFMLSLRADGSPTGHPMTGFYHEGAVWFSSYRKSAKTRNFARDSRGGVLVLNGYEAAKVQAVTVKGAAALREAAEMPSRPAAPARSQSAPGNASRAQDRMRTGQRIAIQIVATQQAAFTDEASGI